MSPRRPTTSRARSAAAAVRLDVEPRRSRAALTAAIGAAVLLIALVLVPPVLRLTRGATSEAANAGILLLALAAVLIGAVLFVLAIIGLIRSHGTPRIGALLLVIDGLVQLVYGWAGNSTLMVDALRDSFLVWSWAVISMVLTVVGCVFVLARPRPVGTAKEHRRSGARS